MGRLEKSGIFLALVSAVCSAVFMIPWKLAANTGASAQDMVFLLCLVAATLNSVVIFLGKRSQITKIRITKIEFRLSLLFALFTIAGNWASAKSIIYLAPAVVTTLMRVEIIFVALIASYFLSEKINPRFWLGFVLTVVGFLIMQPSVTFDDNWWVGMGLAVTAALVFACKAVFTRAFIRQINPSVVNSLRLWISVILLLPLQWKLFSDFNSWDFNLFALVFSAAFLGPFLGRIAFMNSSRYVEARVSALVVGISPVLAFFFSWVIIEDVPRLWELVGGSFIMVGTIISILRINFAEFLSSMRKFCSL